MAFELQDPAEALTWSFDWDDGPWLATDDSLSSATWAILPTGPTVADLGESANVSSVKVSAMTAGKIYRLTCTMISTDGETGVQTIEFRCGNR